MSLSDLASLGSFVSGVAVLVSLIFLYFQSRQISEQVLQTEKNQRALLNEGVLNRSVENTRWLAQTEHSNLMTRVTAGETEFSAQELFQLSLILRAALLALQNAFVHRKAGLLDQISIDNNLSIVRSFMSSPVYRVLWQQNRRTYAPELVEVIEKILLETQMAKPIDVVARFNADLSRLMAAPSA
jgi:hypothetical protein